MATSHWGGVGMTRNAVSVLLVDDDRVGRHLLAGDLSDAGLLVTQAGSAEEMFEQLRESRFEVVVLDINLPGIDGLTAASELRRHSRMGVILLSVIRDARTRISGIERGADDYLTKPVDPRELAARIRQLASRVTLGPSAAITESLALGHGLRLYLASRQLGNAQGERQDLTPGEVAVLRLMASRLDRPCGRDELLAAISDSELPEGGTRTVDTLVARIRKKFGRLGVPAANIRTVRRAGYQLVAGS